MSLSEQALSTVQERILHVREEINLHLALLESVDASVSNSQALEKELRGQLRELQRQYDNLKQNIDPTGQKTAAPSIISDHILDESAIFNLSREYYPIDSDASQEIKQSENGIGLKDYRESILTEFQHQNRKRQYSEYSEAAALSTRNVAKFQRLTLNSPVNRQKTKSLIVLDSTDESNDHSTELLVRQQKEIEERIQLERLDEQYARRLQSELESNYTDLNDQCHSYMRSPRAKKKITLNSSSSSCSNSKSNYESLKVRQPSIFDFSHQCNGESSNDANNTILIDLDDDSDVKSEITLDSLSSESEAEVEFVRSNTISTGAKINYQDGPKFMFESPKFAMDNVSNGFSHQNSLPSIYQKTPRSLYHFKANNISSKETISNHDGVPLPKSFINTEVKNSEINDECKELAKNIRLDTETRREETPQGLVHPLYEHQKIALFWLKSKEESAIKGGILADDMGLGKTISALALVLSRPSTKSSRKTTLIVGPVALIRQWEREIRVKIRKKWRLSTIVVHGSKKYAWDDISHYDIALTTYGTLSSEFRRLIKWKESHPGQNFDESILKKKFPLVGPKSQFYRIILDEAQSIKNKNTVSAKACFHLNATYRICLTGTPMMNNVTELYSVILFLRVKPYNEWSRFNSDFGILSRPAASESSISSAMKKLQALLKAILLRRTKNTLIDGKPIISLPPKIEKIQHVVFNDDESAFYNALESKSKIQFNNYLAAGSIGKNYSNILVLLLRLRQACCHPHLIYDFDQASGTESHLKKDEMIELAKSLSPDVVERLLNCDGAFECPICYDGVENPRIILPCGHDTCTECLAKITDQQTLLSSSEYESSNEIVSKCPSCRGPLILSKVIDYASFKNVHGAGNTENQNKKVVSDTESDSETEYDDSETEYEDVGNLKGDLRDFIVSGPIDGQGHGKAASDFLILSKRKNKGKGKSSKFFRPENKHNDNEKKIHLSLAMLKQEANKSAINRKRYMKYLKSHWQPSAKITKCMELIRKFLDEKQKILIFSQFVSLLDLLQVPIEEERWNYLRYDGSMSADLRHFAIEKFSDSTTHNIMLLSLKAGNAGLNLISASRVIILDPFWNPFIEMQAVDRAHRIGQQNTVEIHRILIKSTVEDRIVELQERKRKLVDMALDEGAARSLGRLNEAQLVFLFGGGPT